MRDAFGALPKRRALGGAFGERCQNALIFTNHLADLVELAQPALALLNGEISSRIVALEMLRLLGK